MKTILIIALFITAGCNNNQGDNASQQDSVVTAVDSQIIAPPSKTDFTKDSIIQIRFPADSTSITVKGSLKGVKKPITVYIPIVKGGELTATIVADDSLANIRINQIFTPDGKADGPFGRELKRKVTQQGTYKLIIAENMMQGDEWKGEFLLTVRVE